VPRANLLYSPRNKILATSLLIEAFLYEEQTRRLEFLVAQHELAETRLEERLVELYQTGETTELEATSDAWTTGAVDSWPARPE
jgi:hypothetical protein